MAVESMMIVVTFNGTSAFYEEMFDVIFRFKMNTYFVRLPQCGGKTYFLLTHLKDEGKEGFDLTLTDGDKFWEGQCKKFMTVTVELAVCVMVKIA